MKAWSFPKYGQIDDLVFGEKQTPTITGNEVLVRIHASAINPADLMLISGKGGGKFLHASNFPITPGFDFSGVIENVGANIRDLKSEQEVFGFLPYNKSTKQGTLAEYVAVPSNIVSPKPTNVSHEEAAASGTTASTALQALRGKGALMSGQRILINGASGGVGSYAVQIASHAGATVVGTCSSDKMSLVRSLGAAQVIDYRKTNLNEIDGMFDIIFDVASALSFNACTSKLKLGGNYITLRPSFALARGKLRSFFSSKGCHAIAVKPVSEDLAQVAAWLAQGAIKSHIGASYPLTKAKEAFHHLARGVAGKIVIKGSAG